jgi:hypothetical protein
MSSPVCLTAVPDIIPTDFQYYDKDGFELNLAERKFYDAQQFPIHHPILNHCCWQEPWFETSGDKLILDHAMFLCRASYAGAAQEQLEQIKFTVPLADYLLRTKKKWGFDFALDAVSPDGSVFEVLHVEYDSYDYETFVNRMISFEYTVRNTNWHNAADYIWNTRDLWQQLQGFEQNHWKASSLIGWTRAEYTEKSV